MSDLEQRLGALEKLVSELQAWKRERESLDASWFAKQRDSACGGCDMVACVCAHRFGDGEGGP